jgi:hypothetical protein
VTYTTPTIRRVSESFEGPHDAARLGASVAWSDRHVTGRDRARRDDDMVTVAEAARVAQRSVRTIRRAYLSGRLVAHRDGNGRGVSIRYGDLVAWLTAEVIVPTPDVASSQPIARVDVQKRAVGRARTENLELLSAVRQRRARRARTSSAARPGPKRADSGMG